MSDWLEKQNKNITAFTLGVIQLVRSPRTIVFLMKWNLPSPTGLWSWAGCCEGRAGSGTEGEVGAAVAVGASARRTPGRHSALPPPGRRHRAGSEPIGAAAGGPNTAETEQVSGQTGAELGTSLSVFNANLLLFALQTSSWLISLPWGPPIRYRWSSVTYGRSCTRGSHPC